MNSWINNFKEYRGLHSPYCITCKYNKMCDDVNYTYCVSHSYKIYKEKKQDETKRRA